MPSATVLSVGSVTISASGGYTGDLLAKVTTAAAAYTPVIVGATDTTIPPAPTTGGPFELVINPGYTGSLTIPTGYVLVVDGATANTNAITGGDPTTTIVGGLGTTLNYTGAAGTVIGTGGAGTVDDTGTAAVLSFSGGDYNVTAAGGSDTIVADTGTSGTFTASGSGDTVIYGTPSGSSGVSAATAAPSAAATITSTGANATLFANTGGATYDLGPSTTFESAANIGSSTLVSSSGGADTVFATSGVDYNATAATSSIFVGSNTAAVTVTSATNESLFGGAAGGTYTEGADSTGSFFFWGRHAGTTTVPSTSDTLIGTGSSPNGLIWGASAEDTNVTQSGTAAFGKGNTFVVYGEGDTINATASRGGDSFVIFNIAFTSDATTDGNFSGNSTLIGASSGNELFGVFDNLGFGASGPAHTIDIQDWQSSDVLGLGGYGSADITTADAALSAANGGSASFTLSDGTTIKFDTTSPGSVGYHI